LLIPMENVLSKDEVRELHEFRARLDQTDW
jgi:hypothetical protein